MDISEATGGTYAIRITGDDAFVRSAPFSPGAYDPQSVYVISFEYRAPEGLDFLEIFYGATSATRKVTYTDLPASSEYRTFKAFMKFDADNWNSPFQNFRFDFSRTGRYSLSVRNLQLRAPTDTEVIPLALNLEERQQMNTTVNDDGSVTITTAGRDPFIATEPIGVTYDPKSTFVLSYDYVCASGLDLFQAFFGFPWAGTRRADFGPLPASGTPTTFVGSMKQGSNGGWTETGVVEKLRFDFGRLPDRTITIDEIYLREPTFAEIKAFAPPPLVDTVAIELDVTRTSGDLTATEVATGSYLLDTKGNDPWIRAKSVEANYDIDSTYILEFEYLTAQGYNELQLFFGPPITGAQSFVAPDALTPAPEWTTRIINPRLLVDNFQDDEWFEFRFDFGRQENVDKTVQIRNLILRKPTAQELIDEQNSDKFVSRRINDDFLEYLGTDFANSVSTVRLDLDQVTVSGTVSGAGPYYLAEVAPHEYGFDLDSFTLVVPLEVVEGSFTTSQPRYFPLADRDYDRLYSRWAVVTATGEGTYALASNLGWATDIIGTAINNLPERKATSKKGLDGLTPRSLDQFQDLLDLGITNMKINVLINGIYAGQKTGLAHEFNGKTYNINPNYVANLDARIKACTDADINTSIVFLVPIRSFDPDLRRRLIHPDAYLGNYSMANVATEEGVEYYTALIDFMAKRYSRPDGKYGRLDQWIIHNEVDAHTDWTHAGEKPVELYTQIYDRSMRLVHYTIRKHDPTAKVFASFTKHFNSKPGNPANFRSRDILDVLGQLSTKEGEYEWNIGWHSYPADLRNASTWNDPVNKTRLDFGTPEITPRNLEMIDAYVRQKSLLYNGKKVRTVLLSENGFNSNPDNAGSSEELQAAAIAYFWKKVEGRLPAIENIQYHRWVDFPTEGGILFGLWGNAPGTGSGNFGYKKEGWYVWEAAGTVEQEQIFAPYKSVIGIDDWSEVQYQVATQTTPYRVGMQIANCSASLADLLISFNGEQKIPLEGGVVNFFNVASAVPQPYTITKGGIVLATDTLYVDEDTELFFDFGTVDDLTARGLSPTTIELSYAGPTGATFVVERSAEGGAFVEVGRTQETTFLDQTVTTGTDYTYRVAIVLGEATLSCYSHEVTVTAPYILVDYANGDVDKPANKKITPILRLRNAGEAPVPLSELTLRYWFTTERTLPLRFAADEEIPFADGITGTFREVDPARTGADYYLEVSFTADYIIAAAGRTPAMRLNVFADQSSTFDETNDYSYRKARELVETRTVTAYRNGSLIWGDEPDAALAATATAPAATLASQPVLHRLRTYPNPASDQVDVLWDAAIIDYQLRLTDMRGVLMGSRPRVAGNRLRFTVSELPAGIYHITGQINGEPVTTRLAVSR